MTSSKSNKHSLISPTKSNHAPTKSNKAPRMVEASRKSKKPSTMASELHQPPPVVEEHHEEMTEREESQPEGESLSESESGFESESASASSEEKTAEEEQEEEEDEGDENKNSDKSDSDSEVPVDEIAFTVKPVVSEKSTEPKASTPVVNQASKPLANHASSSKRLAESESVPKESKRKKLTVNGDEHDAKKGRVWTEEDELVIFNGLIAYQKRKKGLFTNADTGEFHQFIKKNLHLEADDVKLSDKIRRLKSKYFSKGQDQIFTKPHDIKMFELSMKIWGTQDIVAGDSARRSNQKLKSMVVSEEAGARSKQKPESMGISEVAGNKSGMAEMEEEVKFAGGVKKEPDDFWMQYPSLSLCLSSWRSCDLSSQLRQKIPLLGSNKITKLEELGELEKKWSDIQVAELELSYKKDDVRMKLTKFVLDLMDSRSKK